MSEIQTKAARSPRDLIAIYRRLRAAKEGFEERVKQKLKPVNEAMSSIESLLLAELDADGATSVRTEVGTAYIKHADTTTIGDRAEFVAWLLEDPTRIDTYADLKANKTAVRALIDDKSEAGGAPPPGVKFSSTRIVRVQAR